MGIDHVSDTGISQWFCPISRSDPSFLHPICQFNSDFCYAVNLVFGPFCANSRLLYRDRNYVDNGNPIGSHIHFSRLGDLYRVYGCPCRMDFRSHELCRPKTDVDCGLFPLHLFLPAFPIFIFFWSGFETMPIVALAVLIIFLVSPDASFIIE